MTLSKKIAALVLLLSTNLFASTTPPTLQSLPAPYNALTQLLPFEGHGWYTNGEWIEKLIKENSPKTIVEVGSWLGSSTRHIASISSETARVFAIDTWEGSSEHKADPAYQAMLPQLYNQFLSNVVHAGLTAKITPIKMPSQQAALKIRDFTREQIDFIYIDAGHETAFVLEDLNAWFPFVKGKKGIICGDDWGWDSVKAAVRRFAQDNNLAIYCDDNFFFLKEEGVFIEKSFKTADASVWKQIP